MPGIVISTKSDLPRTTQKGPLQPDVFCARESLPLPIGISTKSNVNGDLFQRILLEAIKP